MATVKVIHKTRAYIRGITYDPGQEAEIDENDFAESTHTLVEEPAPIKAPKGRAKDEDDGK